MPSQTEAPSKSWPPERTATSSPISRAYEIAFAASSRAAHRTIICGCLSVRGLKLKTRRAESYSASLGRMTLPAMLSRKPVWARNPPRLPISRPRLLNCLFTACMDGSVVGSSRLLAAPLPMFPRGFQLPIPLGLDLRLMPGEHVLRRDVARGAVQVDAEMMRGRTFGCFSFAPCGMISTPRSSTPGCPSLPCAEYGRQGYAVRLVVCDELFTLPNTSNPF